MAKSQKMKHKHLETGAMFSVPLYQEEGFAYGYVSLSCKGYGNIYNIFDYTGSGPEIPDNIESKSLIVRDMIQNYGPFVKMEHHPKPWIEVSMRISNPLPPKHSRFIIGTKIKDIANDSEQPAAPGDNQRYRRMGCPFNPHASMMIEALLRRRHLEFDSSIRKFYLGGSIYTPSAGTWQHDEAYKFHADPAHLL